MSEPDDEFPSPDYDAPRGEHLEPITHPSYDPVALAIGKAAITWNWLHEALRELYAEIEGGMDLPNAYSCRARRKWSETRSDTGQRKLLRDAAD